jgi:hypothetical protein
MTLRNETFYVSLFFNSELDSAKYSLEQKCFYLHLVFTRTSIKLQL